MSETTPPRQPYVKPKLSVFGDMAALTLTVAINKNKNDSINGGNNLKT
ncbi:hypothetical protein [Longimicrobium terrae]|uniref:Uncharacterized protein n=1 Tax=Longimicrobium terrae TaxID=1639882 RepID=A0A841H6U4_9BACT|nr:hypothetical protein [Longimicrobium terrae]MBB4639391.1 hypothetical protein [Longimicrobium terrae]MBB6073698.1 hypothetical protein [Longimicrobium terrae]NNC30643.1 hypothetical protein [Longimicrobium terrae]